MEQRNTPRKTAGIGAVVSCPQFGLFRGEIHNLSDNGLYLCTKYVRMCLNAPVTVTFQPDASDPWHCCNASGVVVRQDHDGIGILLSETDESVRCELRDLLRRLPGGEAEDTQRRYCEA